MNRCTECSTAIVARDFEAWNEYGVCERCLSRSDSPESFCKICKTPCKALLDDMPVLCGGDFCMNYPDEQIVLND